MQAIVVKYHPCTDTLPARLIARCRRGMLKMSVGRLEAYNYPSTKPVEQKLVHLLCAKFQEEDVIRLGPSILEKHYPWIAKKFVEGQLPNGDTVFVRKP